MVAAVVLLVEDKAQRVDVLVADGVVATKAHVVPGAHRVTTAAASATSFQGVLQVAVVRMVCRMVGTLLGRSAETMVKVVVEKNQGGVCACG